MAKTKKKNPAKQATEDKAKPFKKFKKKKSKSGLDEYFGALFGDNMQKKGAAGGPIPKNKPKKAPPGTKIGPGRKDKKGVPHGVDDDTIYLKEGGSASKFPDLSGDGKVTQKDILMGRGVIKKRKGGKVTGRSIGPAGASIVSDDGKRIKQSKTIAKSVGIPGAAAGLASGIQKTVKQLAGRLAKRGYGKARK